MSRVIPEKFQSVADQDAPYSALPRQAKREKFL